MRKAFPILPHLLALGVVVIYVTVGYFFHLGCPVFTFLGIPCPTCGVTRALLSLLRFDMGGYLHYHALALPLLASVWLMLHQGLVGKRKTVFWFVLFTLMLNTVYYAFRLYCFFTV